MKFFQIFFNILYILKYIVPIIVLSIGLYFTWNSYNFFIKWEKTTGIVASYKTNNTGGRKKLTSYSYFMEYSCNWILEKEYSDINTTYKYNIWKKVDIYCDPNNPKKFIIDSFVNRYLGLIFLIAGAVYLLKFYYYKKNNKNDKIDFKKMLGVNSDK